VLVSPVLNTTQLDLYDTAYYYCQEEASHIDVDKGVYLKEISYYNTYIWVGHVGLFLVVYGELVGIIQDQPNPSHNKIWASDCIRNVDCMVFEHETNHKWHQRKCSQKNIEHKIELNHVNYSHL